MERAKEFFTHWLKGALNVFLGGALVIGLLFIVAQPGVQQERDTANRLLEFQEQTYNATLAEACLLALPVNETGRDFEAATECFTQYGLEAPNFVRDSHG